MRRPLPALPRAWPPPYPPHRPVAADAARDLDREAQEAHGVPSLVLMEHASVGIASLTTLLAGDRGRVVVLCGPGNNGGDGYGAARFLASWGFPVRVLACSRRTPPRDDAAREVAWSALNVEREDVWEDPGRVAGALQMADVVVDALFGVGLDRDLEAPFPDWIRAVNAADCLRLAVDVPSGLDSDTGRPRPVAVRADVTATMAMPKAGLLMPGSGAEHAGLVVEVDIGLPGSLHRRWVQ